MELKPKIKQFMEDKFVALRSQPPPVDPAAKDKFIGRVDTYTESVCGYDEEMTRALALSTVPENVVALEG